MRKLIPWGLVWFRLAAALAVVAITLVMGERAHIIVLVLLLAGFLSDIFDGIVARSYGVATATLRRFDSVVDRVFWLALLSVLVVLWPGFFRAKFVGIALVVGLEAFKYLASFIRFHKELAAHSFLSKAFGVCMLVAFAELLARSGRSWFFDVAVVVGIVSRLDSILILFLLPEWEHDIPSAYHAWRIRKGLPIRRSRLFNG